MVECYVSIEHIRGTQGKVTDRGKGFLGDEAADGEGTMEGLLFLLGTLSPSSD